MDTRRLIELALHDHWARLDEITRRYPDRLGEPDHWVERGLATARSEIDYYQQVRRIAWHSAK